MWRAHRGKAAPAAVERETGVQSVQGQIELVRGVGLSAPGRGGEALITDSLILSARQRPPTATDLTLVCEPLRGSVRVKKEGLAPSAKKTVGLRARCRTPISP
jgi:hypothetical protein